MHHRPRPSHRRPRRAGRGGGALLLVALATTLVAWSPAPAPGTLPLPSAAPTPSTRPTTATASSAVASSAVSSSAVSSSAVSSSTVPDPRLTAPAAPAELSPRVAQAVARLALTSAALAEAQRAVRVTAQEAADAEAAYTAARSSAAEAQVAVAVAEQASREASDQAAQARAARGRLAGDAYRSGGTGGLAGLAHVLVARNPGELRDRLLDLSRITDRQNNTLHLAQARSAVAARRLQVTDAQSEVLTAAREESARTLLRFQAAEAAQRVALASLAAAAAVQQRAVAEAQAALSAEDVSDAAATRTASTGLGDLGLGAPSAAAGSLLHPVEGPVTSPFGMRVHPVTGVYKLHTGTDFGVPCGTPVHAAAAGIVHSSGWNTAYGNRLVVVHPELGIATTYNHLTVALVAPGTTVTAGEVVALSGTTGYSTGCHLHFEVVAHGAYVDPELYLVQ